MKTDRFFSQLPTRKLKIHVNPPIIFLNIASSFSGFRKQCQGTRKWLWSGYCLEINIQYFEES